jgi:hypothetical protein
MEWKPPGAGNGLAQHCRDLLVRQFLWRRLEQHPKTANCSSALRAESTIEELSLHTADMISAFSHGQLSGHRFRATGQSRVALQHSQLSDRLQMTIAAGFT